MIRFLVDAQLPLRLARTLAHSGFDTLHTKDLPRGNATPDSDINRISLCEERVVITKDADFAQTFLVRRELFKLLLVSTGNINNRELERLLKPIWYVWRSCLRCMGISSWGVKPSSCMNDG